jgi:hypothetical protein
MTGDKMVGLTMSDMVRLPWHWHGPKRIQDPDGEYYELRIEELPDFFLAAPTRDQVLTACAQALAAFLHSYLDHGETPPFPAGSVPGWRVTDARVTTAERVPEAGKKEAVLVPA